MIEGIFDPQNSRLVLACEKQVGILLQAWAEMWVIGRLLAYRCGHEFSYWLQGLIWV